MGDRQDPKIEVRKRTIFLAELWGYSLKFSPEKLALTVAPMNRFLKWPLNQSRIYNGHHSGAHVIYPGYIMAISNHCIMDIS